MRAAPSYGPPILSSARPCGLLPTRSWADFQDNIRGMKQVFTSASRVRHSYQGNVQWSLTDKLWFTRWFPLIRTLFGSLCIKHDCLGIFLYTVHTWIGQPKERKGLSQHASIPLQKAALAKVRTPKVQTIVNPPAKREQVSSAGNHTVLLWKPGPAGNLEWL